jgi:DNA ligase 1
MFQEICIRYFYTLEIMEEDKNVQESSVNNKIKKTDIDSKIALAKNWDTDINPTGYIMSEKYDGMRAYWDGNLLWSRLGTKIHAPPFFLSYFPKEIELDGELYIGYGKFDKCMSVCRTKNR